MKTKCISNHSHLNGAIQGGIIHNAPRRATGIFLLDDVVGEWYATIVYRRFPGEYARFGKHVGYFEWALGWLGFICEKIISIVWF